MSRLFLGPPWRFVILLVCGSLLGAAMSMPAAATQVRADGTQQGAGRQREIPDPDERAAGGEEPEEGVQPDTTATLLLVPSRLEVAPGDTVELSLSIIGARDLSRLPVTVRYDPDVVEVRSVSLGPAWADLSRPVFLYDVSRPGEIVIGLAQLSAAATTVTGTAELLDIEFRARRRGTGEVYLDRYAIIGSGSKTQPADALAATITVR